MFHVCLFFTCVSLSIKFQRIKESVVGGSSRADNRNGRCGCTRDSDSFCLSFSLSRELSSSPESRTRGSALVSREQSRDGHARHKALRDRCYVYIASSPSFLFLFYFPPCRFFEEECNYSVIHIQERDYVDSRSEVDGKCMARCVVIHSKCKALRCTYIHMSLIRLLPLLLLS